MKLKYFSLAFSIIGILILYFISTLTKPAYIEIFEIPNFEGKQVVVEGVVTHHQTSNYGSQIITIKDNNASTKIFVEEKIEVDYGDQILAVGQVQKYKDEWEVVTNDKRSVSILEKWHNISIPLWQLAEAPTRYLGLNVNVTGYIDTFSNSYFNLVDLEEKYSLMTFYSRLENFTLLPGEKVNVEGKFSFDEKNFRYILEVHGETHRISYVEGL
jgi:hypothetical protein